jgi:hypothetical protein
MSSFLSNTSTADSDFWQKYSFRWYTDVITILYSRFLIFTAQKQKEKNSMAFSLQETVPTELLLLVSELSAKFCGAGVSHHPCNGSAWTLFSVF